jgi:PEGA domain-containing protein
MDGQDLIKDEFGPTDESGKRLTTWYAQGHSDALGDRLLMFDNTSAPSWEILRFKPDLAADARFETELRHRVDQLSSFRHPAFPAVRPITELDLDEDLAVVSTYASGVSLSDGLKKPRSAMFAVRLLRQLVPAVASLQQHGPGISHGAITLERLVLTAEGRLMVREHMVGSAIERLQLSPMTLWSEFGLLVPASSGTANLGPRCDVVQMALAALSLMTGRRIGRDEYPDRVPELLDAIEDRSLWHEPEAFRSLRVWLERALQLGDRVFDSASDAYAALGDLKEDPPRRSEHPSLYLAQGRAPHEAPAPTPPESPVPPPSTASLGPPKLGSSEGGLRVPDAMYDVTPLGIPPRRTIGAWLRDARVLRWAAMVVGVFALGEAAFIGRLLLLDWSGRATPATVAVTTPTPRPDVASSRGNTASSDRPQLTPLQVDVPPPPTAVVPTLAVASAPPPIADLRPAAAITTPQRSGGFRISAPVQVHVLDGERLLGSSADGPIIAAAGRHEFEFVNSAIGFRARRVVDVKAGEITIVSVTVPDGTLNINAVPWAAVWIDGTSYGETPLGNLSIAPGEHEVVFRHPQFGERREKAVVRAETTTRVAVSFR